MLKKDDLSKKLSDISCIHIIGASLNKERTAHTAVGEISQRGWRVAVSYTHLTLPTILLV